MNKQRNSILIIVIVILVILGASRTFFSCRSHFNRCEGIFSKNDVDECEPTVFVEVENGIQKLDEGIQKMDEGIQKMDERIAQIDESMDSLNKGLEMSDSLITYDPDSNFRLDTIMYAGYLKKDFPYPIVFHFNEFFEFGGYVVKNEVYYPQSMRGKFATEKLDSTNSLYVTLNTSTTYTFTTSTFFSSKSRILEMVNYKFTYPLKTSGGVTVANDHGQFKSKRLHISRGLPMGDQKRIAKDKQNRLKLENAVVSRIREQLSHVSGF